MNESASVFSRLESTLADRYRRRPDDSYTTKLFEGGAEVIGAKLCEEAQELAEALAQTGTAARQLTIHEAADVVYHLMVALQFRQISWQDVAHELARREGQSGLEEKRSRPPRS
jgi:phosphoribosyl-ATP pyrophosphohydrolase